MPLAATSTEQLWFLDTLHTVRVRHGDGEDGISVMESLAPHGDSPPLHVHQTEDETFHVLEGELRLRAGDAEVRIGVGETLLAPKGVPHTYRVESREGARWLVITRHGDFEGFVRALSRPAERLEAFRLRVPLAVGGVPVDPARPRHPDEVVRARPALPDERQDDVREGCQRLG